MNPDPAGLSPTWQSRLNASTTLEQIAEVAFEVVARHLEYDLIELNVLDLSTGVFTAYRSFSTQQDPEAQVALEDGYRLGEGFTGWLVENRQALIVPDIRREQNLTPHVDKGTFPFRSYLGLPVVLNDEILATLELVHRDAGRYIESHVALIESICDSIAGKLSHIKTAKDLKTLRLQSMIQEEILTQVKHLSQPGKLVFELARIIRQQLDADWSEFLIYNPVSQTLEVLTRAGDLLAESKVERSAIPAPADSALSSLWKTQDYWIINQLHSDDVRENITELEPLAPPGTERLLIAPLSADGHRTGMIVIGRGAGSKPFSEDHGEILHVVGRSCAPILALALEPGRRQQEPPKQNSTPDRIRSGVDQYSDSLIQVTGELSASMDLDHVLARVLDMLRRAVGADQGAFMLTAEDTDTLILRASSGSLPPPPPGGRTTPYRIDEGLAGWVIHNRMAVCISDLDKDERWIPFGDEIPQQHSALAAPMIVSDEVLGAILLLGHRRDAFSNRDLELVSAAANQIAPAVHNAQLYHLIQDQAERLGLALRTQQVESSQTQAVLHAMTDGVIVTDPRHRILVFNPAVEQITGLSRSDILGHPVFEVLEIFRAVGLEISEKLRQWETGSMKADYRSLPPRRFETDRERVLAIQPAPVVLGDDFLGTITIIRDITREVEVDRMKSEFVATVSHELRSPITPIKGFVDLLRLGVPGSLNEEQAHYLDIIYENIHRLEMLVDELLDISRIEAGKVTLTFQALNVEQLIDELRAHIDHRSNEEAKQIEFHSRVEADLPDIWGDSERVRQVLANLVNNSFDYTPEGGKVEVEAHAVDDQVEISIRDNGMGIAVSEQERIFERFYRGEQALIMGVAGAGLGLSIALTMVEMHAGRIWVNSAGIPGKGSTFTVSLPAAISNIEPERVVRKA